VPHVNSGETGKMWVDTPESWMLRQFNCQKKLFLAGNISTKQLFFKKGMLRGDCKKGYQTQE